MTLRTWSRLILAFLRRDCLFETSYRLQSVFRGLAVLVSVAAFYFMSRLVGGDQSREYLRPYGGNYFTFALIGIAFTGFFNAGIIGFTVAVREQLIMGVFEASAAAPIRPYALLSLSQLWPFGFELVKALMFIAAGALLCGATIAPVAPMLLAATLILSMVVFGSLGVICGTLIIYFKRGDPIAWFFSSLNALAGGVMFPVTLLPLRVRWIAYLNPVTYALNLLRAGLIPTATRSASAHDLLCLTAFALLLLPLSWWVAETIFERARADGNLGTY